MPCRAFAKTRGTGPPTRKRSIAKWTSHPSSAVCETPDGHRGRRWRHLRISEPPCLPDFRQGIRDIPSVISLVRLRTGPFGQRPSPHCGPRMHLLSAATRARHPSLAENSGPADSSAVCSQGMENADTVQDHRAQGHLPYALSAKHVPGDEKNEPQLRQAHTRLRPRRLAS